MLLLENDSFSQKSELSDLSLSLFLYLSVCVCVCVCNKVVWNSFSSKRDKISHRGIEATFVLEKCYLVIPR